jgi:hypothetical protein
VVENDNTAGKAALAVIMATPIVLAWVLAWPLPSAIASALATAALFAWRTAVVGHWWLLPPPVHDDRADG